MISEILGVRRDGSVQSDNWAITTCIPRLPTAKYVSGRPVHRAARGASDRKRLSSNVAITLIKKNDSLGSASN